METTKIDWVSGYMPKHCYTSDSIQFSWLTTPKKNVFLQVSNWHSCRETFITEIPRALGIKEWRYPRKLDLRRMRFVVIRKYTVKTSNFKKYTDYDIKWMKNAKRILNIFEKYLGWGLTSVKRVDSKCVGENVKANTFVFSGSVKWMRSPQLMSLYLLILRLSRHANFQKIKSMEDFDAWIKENKSNDNKDVVYLKHIYPHLFTILDNTKYLFFERSMKKNFTKQTGNQGINNLVKGIADDATVVRFNKIKKRTK